MAKLTKADLLPYDQYVKVKDKFFKEVIDEKKVRRITISDKMSGIFESKITVFYQIQEMIRAEQITNEEYIQEMLDVYNDLLPEANELSMTLFIEIPNQQELREFNKTVVGIEKSIELVFEDETVVSYEPGEDEEDEEYTQSVHYLHFPFTDTQIKKFITAKQIKLKVNHDNYKVETELNETLMNALQDQLKKSN